MASSSGSIIYNVGADNSGFKRVMRDTNVVARQASSKVRGMMNTGGRGVMAAIGVTAVTSMVKSTIDLGSSLSDMATQTMTSVDAFQVLEASAREAGVSTETMQRGLRNININAQKAKEGVTAQADSLKRLGIDADKFIKLPTERKMELLGQAIEGATDKQAAYNDIANILGAKAGPQMLEMMQKLAREGYDEMAKSARESGEVMEEHTIMMLDRSADAIERTKRKIQVGIGGIIEDFTRFGQDGVSNILYKILGVFGSFGGLLIDAFVGIFQRIVSVADAALTALKGKILQGVIAVVNGINKIPGIEIDTTKLEEARADLRSFKEELNWNIAKERNTNFRNDFSDYWKDKSNAIKKERVEEYSDEKAKMEAEADIKAFERQVDYVEEEKEKKKKKAKEKAVAKLNSKSGPTTNINVTERPSVEETVLSDGSRVITKRLGDQVTMSHVSKTGNTVKTNSFTSPEAMKRDMLKEALVPPLEKLVVLNSESIRHLSALSGLKKEVPNDKK